jgi:phage terminase small subunit
MKRPKPTPDLKVHGGYRKDRHAARLDVVPPSGSPICPDDFTEQQKEIWQSVVELYANRDALGKIDTAELIALCETWGLYRQCVEAAKSSPIDKEIRCATVAYLTIFDRLASKFGLTPTARASIKIEPKTKKGVATRKRA